MAVNYEFYERLKDAGITVKELAEKLDIKPGTLYLKLNGDSDFKTSEILKMQEVLTLTDDETFKLIVKG